MSANLHEMNLSKRAVTPSSITAMNVLQYNSANMPDFDPKMNDEMIYNHLRKTFERVEDYTRKAFDGRLRSLIIPGPAGVGKTTPLENMKEEEDPDNLRSSIMSGYVRAPYLYRNLYKYRNRGSLLALDDADSVWKDMQSLNLLKKATDTTRERWITYGSDYKMEDEETGEQLPKRFLFEGGVMFMTNMNFEAAKRNSSLQPHITAMESRSFVFDLGIKTKRHLLLCIYYYANEKGLFDRFGLSREEYKPILDFITKNIHRLREISLRTAVKCAQLMELEGDNWQDAAELMLFQ